MLTHYWKKEYLFLVVALICVLAYYYRDKLNANKTAEYLPILGGLIFGLNTLVQIARQ
ncbi:MAG: hypothetical protein GBAus27B_000185 [Mycoplasmataceae bacterium]|nr:MAG: hypothetical protein GBAus27B_000185 [Mycoplasmataceae bacterium]